MSIRAAADEMRVELEAAEQLVATIGWIPARNPHEQARIDLTRVRSETEKLILYAAGEASIGAPHVRDVVLATDESAGTFALIDLVARGETAKALRELETLVEQGSQPPMILGLIRSAVARMRPDRRAREALASVLDADLAVKTSRGEPRYVLEKLLVEVCAGAPGTPGGSARRSWA